MKGRLANRLRVLRAEQGVTQLEVAKRTGIQVTRYWYFEKGLKCPTSGELAKLAKALRVDAEELGFDLAQAKAS